MNTEKSAFEILKNAIADGSEVIPLIGSGVSIDAGIPSAWPLLDYLIDFHIWVRQAGWPSPRRYLEDNPWPSRHDLAMELITVPGPVDGVPDEQWLASVVNKLKSKRAKKRRELVAGVAAHEMGGPMATVASIFQTLQKIAAGTLQAKLKFPSTTGYRSLLDYTCEGDQKLIDSFFDRIMLGREPTLTHQFVAFLAKRLDSRVVLTTNFDSLIETAMAEERCPARVYEFVRGGPLPSARLVRGQDAAILKLHGGAYSLRTGVDLDEHLDAATLREFGQYLQPPDGRPPGILLVMGYSGSDRRVMDIVEQHVRARHDRAGSEETTRVVWIDRYSKKGPSKLCDIVARDEMLKKRVCVVQYRDCGRFIQELYQRLTSQHAVTRKSYRQTRAHDRLIKPITRNPKEFATELKRTIAAINENNLTVIHADAAGAGTSTMLFQAGDAWEKRKNAIWLNIDAADYRSRATIYSVLINEICRYDRGLSKLHRPLLIRDVDYFTCLGTPRPLSDDEADKQELQVATRLLCNALRRGKYLITFDSLGEFACGHPAAPPAQPNYTLEQRQCLSEMLKAITGKPGRIGGSRVLVAMTNSPGDPLMQPGEQCKQINLTGVAPSLSFAGPVDVIRIGNLSPDDYRILALIPAVFMRKSRSRASLVTMVIRLAEYKPALPGALFEKAVKAFEDRVSVLRTARGCEKDEASRLAAEEAVDGVTQLLTAQNNQDEWRVLEALEGGFYWMHLKIRDGLFNAFVDDDRYVGREHAGTVYHMIADFAYADAFDRSQSMASFIEYFFFRTMSVKHEPSVPMQRKRCEWLVSTLRNDSNRLLGKPALVPLTNHIRTLIELLIHNAGKTEAALRVATDAKIKEDLERDVAAWRDFLVRTVGIYADLLLNCGHPHTALRYRLWQSDLHLNALSDGGAYAQEPDGSLLETCSRRVGELVRFATGMANRGPTIRERQATIQLLVDLGVTVSDPILFKQYRPKRQTNESPVERVARIDVAGQAFSAASSLATSLAEAEESARNLEIKVRAVAREAEFELRLLNVDRFMLGKPVMPCESTQAEKVLKICRQALEDVRHGDKTSRRRRHRAYLYLSKARVQGLQHQWDAAEVTFNRARASLSRSGGSPERSALGVIGLFQAENLLRRVMWYEERAAGPVGPPPQFSADEIEQFRRLGGRALKAAKDELDEATELLLNDSRTENRWRVFLKYLLAQTLRLMADRVGCGDAITAAKDGMLITNTPRSLLDRAMREVINGLTNTGARTDRRDLLQIEANKIFHQLKKIENADPLTQRDQQGRSDVVRRLRIRYGITDL